MKLKSWKFVCVVCLLFMMLASCQPMDPNAMTFEIKSFNKDDQINIRIVDSYALAEVYSQSGMGQAIVTLQSGKVPPKMVFRLYLKGLENFRLIYGSNSIGVSITSTGNQDVRQVISKNGGPAEALTNGSPFWMPLQIVPTGGADKRIPLQSGYIEIEAPRDFGLSTGQSFSIQWIDFYR